MAPRRMMKLISMWLLALLGLVVNVGNAAPTKNPIPSLLNATGALGYPALGGNGTMNVTLDMGAELLAKFDPSNPPGKESTVTLVNATPYTWRKGYVHSYQMGSWNKDWPEVIKPGAAATVVDCIHHGFNRGDSAGEVAYHLEKTSKPMSFLLSYRKNKNRVELLEDLETASNPKRSVIDLENRATYAEFTPSGASFFLAGKEEDGFISNNGPARWMKSQLPDIGNLTLREIVMPRSHHAGFWKYATYVGLLGAIGGARVTQTQERNLYEQFSVGGVRVLDVRPVKRAKGHEHVPVFMEGHGSYIAGAWEGGLGASLNEMVDQTNQFNEDHPGELIIWDLHSKAFDDDSHDGDVGFRKLGADDMESLYGALKRLKHRVEVPDDEDITQWTVNDFIGDGKPAVIVRIYDTWLKLGSFPGGKEGFVTSKGFPIKHRWTNTNKVQKLIKDQIGALPSGKPHRQSTLYSIDWLLTLQTKDLLLGGIGDFALISIVSMAAEAWKTMSPQIWGASNDETYPNWLAMDAIRGNEMKALAMSLNRCMAARKCGSLGGKVKV